MASLLSVLQAWSFVCDLGSAEIRGNYGSQGTPGRRQIFILEVPPATGHLSLSVCFFPRPLPKPDMAVDCRNPSSQEADVEQWA